MGGVRRRGPHRTCIRLRCGLMGAPPELRWHLADAADPQGALFDPVVERHIGKGEYRGMEFLHVNARTIINEVPAASRMPFRFTINAYRGCSHACSYCLAGDTPILMGDGRTKPLAEVAVGDEIYGTDRSGSYRRYVKTRVLDRWSTVKPGYRVSLEDGTEVIASGDHRFLTEGGWKHVTGAMHGRGQRLHLTVNDRLLGTGRFAYGPDQGPDYRRGYLCGMIRSRRDHADVHRSRLPFIDLEARRKKHSYLTAL